jgi:NADPH:quinone reductase-like Zn-dependent oxidoreductase
MKAAVSTRYGSPDVVQIKNVAKPVPRDNEVLIKVRAASVNPLDDGFMKGNVVITVDQNDNTSLSIPTLD